ncbi:MAG: hypothetical protein Q9217_004141 [Psora testacea]
MPKDTLPQTPDNVLQGIIHLISTIISSNSPSIQATSATSSQGNPSNRALECLSKALHNALSEGRSESKDDILAHVGFLADIADILSQKLSQEPLKRARLRLDLCQIQKQLLSARAEPPSENLSVSTIPQCSKRSISKEPRSRAAPYPQSSSHEVLNSSFPTSSNSRSEVLSTSLPTTTLEAEHFTSSNRRNYITGADETERQIGLNRSLSERISQCLHKFNQEEQGKIQGIFTPAAFSDFITLWDHSESITNDTFMSHVDSLELPRILREFEEPYLHLFRLHRITPKSTSPLRLYLWRMQLLRLYNSIEDLTKLLREDQILADKFLDIILVPREATTIGLNMIGQYLQQIDRARERIVPSACQRELDMSELMQLMDQAQAYHILTEEFGMGIMALIPTTWGLRYVFHCHDVTKAVAKAVHEDCPAARSLCEFIEKEYMRPIKESHHFGDLEPCMDQQVLLFFKATLSQIARAKNVAAHAERLFKSDEVTTEPPMSTPEDKLKKSTGNPPSAESAALTFLNTNQHLLVSAQAPGLEGDLKAGSEISTSPKVLKDAATVITTRQPFEANADKPAALTAEKNVPPELARQQQRPQIQPHKPLVKRNKAVHFAPRQQSQQPSLRMHSEKYPSYANVLEPARDFRPPPFARREVKTPSPQRKPPISESASPSERSRDRRRAQL